LVQWLAILCWYSVLALHPRALQVVQFGHALQYLPFPLRVKMNQMAGKPAVSPMRFAGLAGLILVPSTLALFSGGPTGSLRSPGQVQGQGLRAETGTDLATFRFLIAFRRGISGRS